MDLENETHLFPRKMICRYVVIHIYVNLVEFNHPYYNHNLCINHVGTILKQLLFLTCFFGVLNRPP